MKTTSASVKSFQPALIATMVVGIALFSAQPAQANYIVTLQQVGSNVVATGSGAIDLSGLMDIGSDFGGPGVIAPDNALISTGSTGFFEDFSGFSVISGPTSFGSGGGSPAFSGTGDHVGINGVEDIPFVPQNYVSGNPLSDSSIYPFQTFGSLGVTPGTYKWTWGTRVNQNFTLDIPAPTVPDTGSTFGLLLLALTALFGANRLRSSLFA